MSMTTKVEKISGEVLYTVVFVAYINTDKITNVIKNPAFFRVADLTRERLEKNFKIEDFIEFFNLDAKPEDVVIQKIVTYPQVKFTCAWFLN